MFCGYDGKRHDKSGGYKAAHELDGGPFDFNYDYWVCAGCGLPTRQVFEVLTDMLIPRVGTGILSSHQHEDGTSTQIWSTQVSGERVKTMTFHPYPFGADLMHPGRSHLLMIWEKLDAALDLVMDPISSQKEIDEAKSRGGAFAEVIAQLMSPYYNSRDAVVSEAVERHNARKAGAEHETPGLAEVYWNPAPVSDVETSARNGGSTRTVTPAKLDDQKTAFVKHALETGAMDAKALADMFGVSMEVIKAAVDS